ncbi:MAG: transcriptional regulator [Methanomassiliicoccaceae archaeon]|nr:transcriptional regulator [Methanomassiliicoccaceae archaeon]
MYSKPELLLLSHVGRGAASVADLCTATGLSKVQVYRTVASLDKKGAVRLDSGGVAVRDQAHLYALMNVMHDSASAVTLLAGNGLDVVKELREPRTARDVSQRLGVSQRTVSRSIKGMMNVGMLSKDGDTYTINARMWPELPPLADRYADYAESFDERVPIGSRIYRKSKGSVVFSNDRDLCFTKTAFSRFEEYGIGIYLDTHYYCDLAGPPTVGEIISHCLDVISVERNWRLRMMALIFYKKHRDGSEIVTHPMIAELEQVLRTKVGKVEGWIPLREMQERAEMYGVDLYDD